MGTPMTDDQRDSRIEAAGFYGKPINCTQEEYHGGLRGKIQQRAGEWVDTHQDIRAQIALAEVQRLDKLYGAVKSPVEILASTGYERE